MFQRAIFSPGLWEDPQHRRDPGKEASEVVLRLEIPTITIRIIDEVHRENYEKQLLVMVPLHMLHVILAITQAPKETLAGALLLGPGTGPGPSG